MPITVVAARQFIRVKSHAVAAGNAILPRSPGEIVTGERLARPDAGESLRHQSGADGVLHAGAKAADHQRGEQHPEPDAGAGDEIADPGQRGAEAEDQRPTKALGDRPGRDLEPGHRPDIERAQQTNRGVVEAELRLPQRQQHVEQIGIAVVQDMGAAGDAPSCAAPARRCGQGSFR